MTVSNPSLHHIVFCLRPESIPASVAFWEDLGMVFENHSLAELGLSIYLDWDRGIELIAPMPGAGAEAADFVDFLRDQGEGVYSVVVRTDGVEGPIGIAKRYGGSVEYAQHRGEGDQALDEARISPINGMAITFLSTARP
jgi:methylmalonyl-CoA/ethylmalonyl-CoA epimerase